MDGWVAFLVPVKVVESHTAWSEGNYLDDSAAAFCSSMAFLISGSQNN